MSPQPKFRQNLHPKLIRATAGVAALLAGLTAPALAVEKHWNTNSGGWGIGTNWNPQGIPGPNDIVYVDFWNGAPGFATVSTDVGSPISASILNDNTARISNFGSMGVQGDLIVGRDNTHGTFNVTNNNPIQAYFGQLTVGNTLRIGLFSGIGTFNQNDGVVNVNQLVRVGDRNQSGSMFTAVGTYNLTGGTLNAARLEVGYGGDTGQFPNMDGIFNLSGTGVLNVSLGAQIPDPKIGGGGARGVVNQTGGTFNSPFRIVDIGRNGGSGVYNYSGGSFSVAGIAISSSSGTFNYLAGNSLSIGQLTMSGGRVNVAPGGGKILRSTVMVSSTSNWTVDLSDNAMVVLATVGESVHSAIFRGFNNGSWNGTGIRSSAAAAAPHLTRALGFGQAGDLGFSEYGGQAVAPTAWIIQYTRMGDANLDGVVNLADFNRLAANFGAADMIWTQGDFNYDGVVSLHDFNLMAANFGLSASGPGVTPEDWSALAAAIPEPSILALLGVPASAGMFRRRRARAH